MIKKFLDNGNLKYTIKSIEIILIAGFISLFAWILLKVNDLPVDYASASEVRVLAEKVEIKVNKTDLVRIIEDQNIKLGVISKQFTDLNCFLMDYFANTKKNKKSIDVK